MAFDYDLIIIGSGPGGHAAAIKASELGIKTALVEEDMIGGVCLHSGCIPSKSLIHQANIFRSKTDLEKMGISLDTTQFSYENVQFASRKTVETLSKGLQFVIRQHKIPVIAGRGIISDKNTVCINDHTYLKAKNIIIATGSKPREIRGVTIDEKTVLSSTGILMTQELPKSLLIIGSGAIGIEFAHIMSSFGTEVFIVEMMGQILPLEDEETVKILVRSFKKRGIKMVTSSKVISVEKQNDFLEATIEQPDGKHVKIQVDKILSAIGRVPNSENIGLENAGIKTDGGFVVVDDFYRTTQDNIYAIGDVINTPLLAHAASREGELAVNHIAGKKISKINSNEIPGAIYGEPQIASFGYTEQKAKQENIEYEKEVFQYRACGKAVAMGKIDGLVKILVNPNDKKIIGAHIVGTEATEMIHELLLAKKANLPISEIAEMIHAHPTLSETVMETAKRFGQ